MSLNSKWCATKLENGSKFEILKLKFKILKFEIGRLVASKSITFLLYIQVGREHRLIVCMCLDSYCTVIFISTVLNSCFWFLAFLSSVIFERKNGAVNQRGNVHAFIKYVHVRAPRACSLRARQRAGSHG